MSQKYKIVIADASCFILLDKIGELSLLQKLYLEIATTKEVAEEYGHPLPEWVKVKNAKDYRYQLLLQLEVDKGEASAIALSAEEENSLLIIDDNNGRKMAVKLHLNFIGTFGVIINAKNEGIISSIKPIIEKVKLTNFRYSEKLYREVLFLANEASE